MQILICDALTCGDGERSLTRDFIGAGPRTVASVLYSIFGNSSKIYIKRFEELLNILDSPNARIFNPITQALELLEIKTIDILMISAMSMDEKSVLTLIKKWKQHSSSSSLISLGGPIVSDPFVIKRVGADIAMIGESESLLFDLFSEYKSKTFEKAEFLKHAKTKPNIAFLNQAKKVEFINAQNPSRYLSRAAFEQLNLDPRFITAYSDFVTAKIYVECVRGCSNYRRTSIPIDNHVCNPSCGLCRGENFKTSRNCPSEIHPGCGFCSTNFIHGPVRSKSVEAIKNEIQKLIDLGAKRIVLGGPDFLDFRRELLVPNGEILSTPTIPPPPNYEELNRLVESILKIKQIQTRDAFVFIENIKAALCTDQALDILAKLPDPIFSIGCETGSDRFADILGRPNCPSITYDAVKRAIQRGIRIHVYFIHDLPGDTVEYAKDTLELLNKFAQLNVDKFTIYKYQEVPGSPFYYRNREQKQQKPDPELLKMEIKIKNFVIKYNERKKQMMINKKFRVLIAEPNKFKRGDAIGIIMEGGPKVSIAQAANLINTIQTVRISKVISDKLVEGKLILDENI